jgi:hypothetical protein
LQDGYGIATALNNLALLARCEGRYREAQPLLEESLSIRREMGDKYAIAYSLAGFAARAAGLESPGGAESAARLLAATRALLESIGVRLENVYLSEYERTLAAVREELGELAFAAAWERGRSMAVEQAIAYAMSS